VVVEVIGVGVGERGGGGGGGPERAVEPIWYFFLHHFLTDFYKNKNKIKD
jgi:hypothetical protein